MVESNVIIFLYDDYFVAVELGRFMSITVRIIFIRWNGDPLLLSESKEFALVQEKLELFELLPIGSPVVVDLDCHR